MSFSVVSTNLSLISLNDRAAMAFLVAAWLRIGAGKRDACAALRRRLRSPSLKLAANIGLLFPELAPLERIAAAKAAGFDGVELLFPYDLDPHALRREATSHGLPIVQLNSPPGDRAAGEVGFAALPGRQAQFRDSIRVAIEFLKACGSSQLHVLAGIPAPGMDAKLVRETYVHNLQWVADEVGAIGVRVMIEPLNGREMPGYALSTLAQAAEVLGEVSRPNVGLQFDLYHSQIMGGDITHRLRQFAPLIRHVQIAGAPLRNEPDRGELNLARVMSVLAETGYDGWISAEYRPTGATLDSLEWVAVVREAFSRLR
jgi:hydroxypyruvate isomerase